jgi:succinate dehydrogenase / fumarate reductase cytochrome b subunit
MALTGLGFYGWLCMHMIGNLEILHGRDFFNGYAHFLHSDAALPLLWGSRLFLLVVVGLHALSGTRLWWLNRQARPVGYRAKRWRQASLASRTMIITGALAALFLVLHLGHFTLGWFASEGRGPGEPTEGDVFGMVTSAFQQPLVAVGYALAMALIGFHLWHAVWSALQTLGLNGPKWTPFAKKLGLVLGVALALGFAAIPVSILAGALP